jgi:methionyl-tRNA formyltransferase
MFDTIVLLTGPVEQVALASALRGHNPQLAIYPVATSENLAALGTDILHRARLIAFSSPVIVPPSVLAALGHGAYNFHPGPPEYPGWAPAHFALYEGATEFGATAHAMTARIDSGPIIDVARFAIPANIGVLGLEGLAYANLALLYWGLAKRLATDSAPLPVGTLGWSAKKNSRRAYRAICDIPLDISKEELERRLKIFGGNHFGVAPAIHLHGVEFRAVVPPAF